MDKRDIHPDMIQYFSPCAGCGREIVRDFTNIAGTPDRPIFLCFDCHYRGRDIYPEFYDRRAAVRIREKAYPNLIEIVQLRAPFFGYAKDAPIPSWSADLTVGMVIDVLHSQPTNGDAYTLDNIMNRAKLAGSIIRWVGWPHYEPDGALSPVEPDTGGYEHGGR